MARYEWMSVKNGCDVRSPDYVLPLTEDMAVWCMNNNGYDACLVILDKKPEAVASRNDIKSILHATTAMHDHEPGYAGQDVREASVKKIRSHIAWKLNDVECGRAKWQTLLDSLDESTGNAARPRIDVRPRKFRYKEGWMADLDANFSVFAYEIGDAVRKQGTSLYEYQVLFGSGRKIVQRGRIRTDAPHKAVEAGWESLGRHLDAWNRIYGGAAGKFSSVVLGDTPTADT